MIKLPTSTSAVADGDGRQCHFSSTFDIFFHLIPSATPKSMIPQATLISTSAAARNTLSILQRSVEESNEESKEHKRTLKSKDFFGQMDTDGSLSGMTPIFTIPDESFVLSNLTWPDRETKLEKCLRYKRRCSIVKTMLDSNYMNAVDESERKRKKFQI